MTQHTHQTRWRRGVQRMLIAGLSAITLLCAVVPSSAQDRRTLSRLLREGADFRVRVQAAFAIGNTRDASMRTHLERALQRDSNPAVRAAAATGLGRLGTARALPSLRRARRDTSAAVRMQVERSITTLTALSATPTAPTAAPRTPSSGGFYPTVTTMPSAGQIAWPRMRYVVVVGDMANRSGFASSTMASQLRAEVARNLALLRGVAVLSAPADRAQQRQIRRRNLPQLRLEGNVAVVERTSRRRELSVRCEVSLVLLDEPQRNIRGMLSGAATGTEERRRNRNQQEQRLAQQALSAAVRSAMSSASSALSRAAAGRP